MAANPRALAKALLAANTPSNTPVGGGFGGAPSTLPGNGVSPLVGSYEAWSSGRAYGQGMPRSWETFLSGSFGPLAPIQPVAINEPNPDGSVDPRRFQIPVGWNMPMGPPGSEGLKLACYSADTEILTRRGWTTFDTLSAHDEVATRSEGGRFEWQNPTAIVWQPYQGDAVQFASVSADLLVTPEHRMLHRARTGVRRARRHEERVTLAGRLAELRGAPQLVTTSRYEGGNNSDIHLVATRVPGKGQAPREFRASAQDFAAFMGMWLAEGHISRAGDEYRVVISQSANGKGLAQYRQLLIQLLGIEPAYHRGAWIFRNKALFEYLSRLGGRAWEKTIPREVLDMPADCLELFWRFYWLGDGSIHGTSENIVTTSRAVADGLVEVLQKTGRWGVIRVHKSVSPLSVHEAYRVCAHARPVAQVVVSTVPYSGMVGCVSVPNGIVYVRRNGKPAWCGNSFAQLRTIADTYSVARACISLRKQELVGLEWDVVPTKAAEKKMRGSASARLEWDERRAKVMRFFRKPDSNYFGFSSWFSAQLEDVFAVDALSLYMHPPRMRGKGVMGSNLAALELIDGTTIRPLIDVYGARPAAPNPAYQQYQYGVPRVDLMAVMAGDDVADMAEAVHRQYSGDQLLYLPYEARDWTPYGFAPTEKALVPILSGLNRQNWQLQSYSEGTIPGLFVTSGDQSSSPEQCRQLQDALNAMAGDPAWKHKIIVLPHGSTTSPQTPAELAGTFDEIIMTQVCMGYDVMPMELGISPRTSSSQSSGAANQMAKKSGDTHDRKANGPLLHRFMEIFDYVIQFVCDQPDMRFMFEGLEGGEDEEKQVNILVAEISHGLRSIDEARVIRGEQPWGLPITSDPVMMLPTGILPIGGLDPKTGQLPPPPAPPGAVGPDGQPLAPPPGPVPDGGGGTAEDGTPAHGGADAGGGQAAAQKSVNVFAALRELDAIRRRLAKGRSIDGWVAEHVPASMFATVTDLPSLEAARAALKVARADRCECCGGTGEHDSGRECDCCDGSGQLDSSHDGPCTCHEPVQKHGGHATDVHHVYAYLARHYPANVLEWVKTAHWHGPEAVKLADIDMDRRPGGARNPAKIAGISQAIKDGKEMAPVVLVREPGGGKLKIADGWHRTDAVEHAGSATIQAWVGDVDTAAGPWGARMNRSKLNKVDGLSPAEFTTAIVKIREGAVGDYRARHLIRWFNEGADGRVPWGAPGDLSACHELAAEHMSSDEAWGFCQLRHHDSLGTFNSPKG